MNLFRKNSIPKFLLFLELILLLSAIFAFFACLILTDGDKFEKQATDLGPLFENYQILYSLLSIDQSQFTANPGKITRATAPDNPLLHDLYYLNMTETALKEGRFQQSRSLLNKIKNLNPYVGQGKNRLWLRFLYRSKKYKTFISTYQKSPVATPVMRLYYLNSLWRTGNRKLALDTFKILFSRKRLNFFREELTRQTLASLLSKLESDFWYNKCLYLLQKRSYREFIREKAHIKNRDLRYLFSAEFHYLKRRYKRAKRLLKEVRDEQYTHQIQRLLLKISLRNNPSLDVKNQLPVLKKNRFWYTSFLFNAASIMLVQGESREAIYYFTEFVKSFPTNQLVSNLSRKNTANFWKAHWLMSWLFYKQGDMRQASLYFKRGKLSPIIPYRIASTYWLSRINSEPTDELNFYPYSYYYTKISNKTHITGLNHFIKLLNGEQSPAFKKILADIHSLIQHQMTNHCIPFIRYMKRSEGLNWSDKNMLSLIESIVYMKQNNFFMAFTAFKRNFPQYHSLRLPHFLSSIYFPTAYQQAINRYSRENRMDNLLVFALIRNESFFNPNAVSPAKAHGLMQLLYRTARQVARQLKIRISRKDLFSAEINIRLGIKYLRGLIQKYQGNLALALAAYNAGSRPVDRWLAQFGNVTAEEFIELIPYSETRTYVKNILRNYYYYKFYFRKSSLRH